MTQSVYVLNQWFICKRLAFVVSWHLTQGGRNTILICTFFTLSQTALGTPLKLTTDTYIKIEWCLYLVVNHVKMTEVVGYFLQVMFFLSG